MKGINCYVLNPTVHSFGHSRFITEEFLCHYNWLNQSLSLRLVLTPGLNSLIDFSVVKGKDPRENVALAGKPNIHWTEVYNAVLGWSSHGFGSFWGKERQTLCSLRTGTWL